MSKTLSINTSLSPVYFDKYADNESIVVVIDVLRATSVISTAFHYGVKEIIPVQTLDQALEFKAKENHIVAAERNAMLIDGFDFGNSPFHYMNKDVQDKTLVFTTTNGTKALNMAINHQTITASFVNFDAVADYLINQQQNIILFCSGWKGYFNLEDSIFAGKLAEILLQKGFSTTDDSTLSSIYLHQKSDTDLFAFLNSSSHRNRLKTLNMEEDTKFCLQPDFQSDIVPLLENKKLIKA
ncbi:MAG: 2-phosphosulfolactate phosphatase [Flavobacteriales bacterium]|nr:2-phosphosulfolactate phosphatase [Flavobacteriales bacterium]